MRTFHEKKRFFHQYGYSINYQFADLLHWYFSYPEQPSDQEVREEVLRRLSQSSASNANRQGRKNWYRRRERGLRAQLASLSERVDILEQDRRLGIPPEQSLATKPLRLTIIRSLRRSRPGFPISEIWVTVGDVMITRLSNCL